MARPVPSATTRGLPGVSAVVPACNEAGNIAEILARVPEMGAGTELVFVEGHSTDDTHATIERLIAERPQRSCVLLRQTGKGKGDAVRLGFERARGDVLMILDADLTVPPEDLLRFLAVLTSGRGDFVNGVRLVYPMQERAMRPLNLVGNKFFSLAFLAARAAGQDTLCALSWGRGSPPIAPNEALATSLFGDLTFCAAGLKIVDLPVRHRSGRRHDQHQPLRHGRYCCRCAGAARPVRLMGRGRLARWVGP
jgi:hypothetical protein